MRKQEFDVAYWLFQGENNLNMVQNSNPDENPIPNDEFTSTDIEIIISRIEEAQVDITANYPDWRDVGFGLATEYGENGRDNYHRISQFYSGYNQAECNKQFNACLKSKGNGVTMKTFYHLAKLAGIDINNQKSSAGKCYAIN